MNKVVIPPDALNRFRLAAAQVADGVAPRVSRWLILKDDIAALRKRRLSYRAICELLLQSGIHASPSGLMRFCRSVLKEKRSRKSSVKRRAPSQSGHPALSNPAPDVPAKAPLPPSFVSNPVVPAASSPDASARAKKRGPHIAKVELLPPGETI